MASVKIDISELEREITRKLKEYGESVYSVTEDALDAGAEVLKTELKNASPKKSGKFARGWTDTKNAYRGKRYIGNKTKVRGKRGTQIPLINILEYSTNRGKPFVAKTFNKSVGRVSDAIIRKISQEV